MSEMEQFLYLILTEKNHVLVRGRTPKTPVKRMAGCDSNPVLHNVQCSILR